jgi:cytochrome P450
VEVRSMGLAEHYDHFADEFIVEPFPFWRALREEEPVARSELYGGFYVITRYEDIREAASDYERFSSREGATIPPLPFLALTDVDPPEQREYRRIMNSGFTAEAVSRQEPQVRELAREVVGTLVGRAEFDAHHDLGLKLAPQVTLAYVGFKRGDWPVLINGIEDVARLRGSDPEVGLQAAAAVMGVCAKLVQQRREGEPKGDVVDLILQGELHGTKLNDEQVLRMLGTLLLGAVDTTATAIASSVYYLATRPEKQLYLREHGVSKKAVEEMLRWSSPVQALGRVVTRDTELGGCPLAKDDRVMLLWASGNRQESVFKDADEMDFERDSNPHLTFGHGAHKCVGLNLGRLMLRVALEELLAWTEHFKLGDPAKVTWAGGEVRSPEHVPVRASWT